MRNWLPMGLQLTLLMVLNNGKRQTKRMVGIFVAQAAGVRSAMR